MAMGMDSLKDLMTQIPIKVEFNGLVGYMPDMIRQGWEIKYDLMRVPSWDSIETRFAFRTPCKNLMCMSIYRVSNSELISKNRVYEAFRHVVIRIGLFATHHRVIIPVIQKETWASSNGFMYIPQKTSPHQEINMMDVIFGTPENELYFEEKSSKDILKILLDKQSEKQAEIREKRRKAMARQDASELSFDFKSEKRLIIL